MKKTVIILSSAILILLNCSKKESGNTAVLTNDQQNSVTATNNPADSVVAENSVLQKQEYSERYLAEDGSSATVRFINNSKEKYITVTSNGNTIRADQTEAWAKGAIYKNQDVEIKSEHDNITITQGDQVIALKRAGAR